MRVVVRAGTVTSVKSDFVDYALYMAESAGKVSRPDLQDARLAASREFATEALRCARTVHNYV